MSENHFLPWYNQIALALLLTFALILLAVASFAWWRSTQERPEDFLRERSDMHPVSGEELETSGGIITAYKTKSANDPEALRDVRYVAMATGKVTAISNDAKALVFGEKGVGALGRVALLKTGTRDNHPIFDFIFISFPNLDRHVIARSIDALDTVHQLDDSKFSAIVWDNHDDARFVIIDAQAGSILHSENLNLPKFSDTALSIDGAPAGDAVAEAAEAAPQNRF